MHKLLLVLFCIAAIVSCGTDTDAGEFVVGSDYLAVNNKVIIELKVVEDFTVEHTAQCLTYMRLSECKLGLLLNFYKKSLKDGIKRLIL